MTIPEILEKAKQSKENIKEKYTEKNKDLDFLDSFIVNNNIYSIDGLCRLNLSNYLISSIKANNSNIPLDELKDKIYSNVLLIETLNSDTFFFVIKFITDVIGINKRNMLEGVLQSKDGISRKKLLEELEKNNIQADGKTLSIIEKLTDAKDKPLKILDLIEKEEDIIMESLYSVYKIKILKEAQASFFSEIDNIVNQGNYNINDKEKHKTVNDYLNLCYPDEIKSLKKSSNELSTYHSQQLSLEKQRKKEQRKAMIAYDNLIIEFPRMLQKDEITEYETLISKIPDATLRLEILKQVYFHNQKYYESLEAKRNELSENSAINYQLLLQEYGIPKDTYNTELIMKNSIKDTKYILKKISKMEIKDPESIIQILETTNKKTVDEINFLREKGLLQSAFIGQHKNLFDENSNDYITLFANLDYLNESKISPLYFEQSQDILLVDTEKLSSNVKVLEDYKLITSMNKKVKYDFLSSDNLAEEIDNILELGYENNLETNLNLLNYDKNKWQRIKVLNELNGPIDSTEDLEEVLEAKSFFIPDNKLSDYIYNAVPDSLSFKINGLSRPDSTDTKVNLNDYIYTSRTYKIGNVIISKNKVKRNLNKLKDIEMVQDERLLVSVISGSTLNDEDYNSVRKTLNPKCQ